MKIECKVPRGLNLPVSALCIVMATASHAFANNAPGPLAIVSLFSLVMLIVALTFAGGGYNVLKRIDDAKNLSKVKRTLMNTLEFIAGLLLFFVALFATIIGVAGFSIFAIGRGVKMIRWSKAAEKNGAQPAHLEGTDPKRLKIAGIMLIGLTLLVFGYSVVNLDDVTGMADSKKRMYARVLRYDAEKAYAAAKAFREENPKANMVTCENMVKAGYTPASNVACFSDMTATSGGIRMTGPERWKLKNPVAIITYSGELTPAEP